MPAASEAPTKVTPAQGQELIQQLGTALTIIDVRTPEEFAAGHIEGAVNLDLEGGQFSALIEPLDRTRPYMVYCHSGRRSALAADAMVAAGFTDVHDLGGISRLEGRRSARRHRLTAQRALGRRRHRPLPSPR